ncbi:MAG: histidine triad nucleotide-binding protein [Candidatus Nitrospinota bacterium M3_3B_026]
MSEDCVFCKIISGDTPCNKVAETESLFAFEDINPQAPVHVLIVPKKHVESSLGLADEDAKTIGEAYLLANRIAREKGIDKSGFRIVNNTGRGAGQMVMHLHLHVLGGRPMNWPPG